MDYIDKVVSDYFRTFKVTKEFEFVSKYDNLFKATTYKIDSVYYVKFERITALGNRFYQENHSHNKEDFKQIVASCIYYLNQHS